MSSEPEIEMIYDSNLNCLPEPQDKKLKTLNSMSVAAYTNQKKQKQIRNWKKQYGIVIETDEQFKFFKENRAMVLKTLPIYEQMIKHFPTIIKQSNINF
tara:strand:- start:36 stop:332 length:297 start_codon:yes stop_codon:yes gene_type:complete